MLIEKDNPDFEATMVSLEKTEVCELVGLYILDILTKEFDHDMVGLYRDDKLSGFQNLSSPESEKVKKKLRIIFKRNRLSIPKECNLQITDFLNVTFDLRTDKYYPYRKDNHQLLYINKQPNHPPTITKQIPSMVSRRISDISCNEEYFEKAAPAYNIALKISGFNENIKFTSTALPRWSCNRKITWFNPPYNVNGKPTSLEHSYDSLTSTSRDIINTASYSIEKISRSATVVCQIWQVSSEAIKPVY